MLEILTAGWAMSDTLSLSCFKATIGDFEVSYAPTAEINVYDNTKKMGEWVIKSFPETFDGLFDAMLLARNADAKRKGVL
jgi:hypothetical protein